MTPSRTLILSLLFNSLCALAQEATTEPKPSRNPLHYIPNKPLAVVSGLLYLAIPAICLLWCRKRWARYMLTVMIGGICYAIGQFMRLPFGDHSDQLGFYIVMNMFTVLSPCAFIATAYMLLGRLAIHLDADQYLLVKSRIITKLFLTSDIVTLLIQAGGGSMAASASAGKIGTKIFLIGLIIQLISFCAYMVVYAVFLHRMKTNRPEECVLPRNSAEFFSHWTALAGALIVSCVGILIRSIFRTVENAQGFGGYLATHELYFYVLDTLPLFIAILVFVVTWPPMYLTHYGQARSVDTAVEMGMSSNEQKQAGRYWHTRSGVATLEAPSSHFSAVVLHGPEVDCDTASQTAKQPLSIATKLKRTLSKMARPGRAKSGSHSKSPEVTRKPLPDDPPKSPTVRRAPKYDVNFVGELKPSTPEGWVLFAQTKLWTIGKAADVVQGLADIEPDLLEFLMCADEEIRAAVRNSMCGSAFPETLDRTVEEACRQVTPLTSVLSALDQIQFVTNEREEEEFATKKSQKKRKASIAIRARQNTTTVDPRLFIAVDLGYPTTPQELQEIETEVLQRLQVLLEVLLSAFENPELGTYSKTLVFDRPLQQPNKPSNFSAAVDSTSKEVDAIPASKSGAFPHIRPLAAAKYFEEGSALGAWSIVISGRAVNDLRQMRKGDSHVFAMVEKKITCLYRETPRAPGQNVTLPAHFPYEDVEIPEDSPPPTTSDGNKMSDKDLLNLHSLIALEKFIPMSQALIDAILNNSDANHVFHVSAKEKEIIYHDSACFVLGRSGTGKTTSIVFKMIGIEKLFEQMEEVTKPRQVFVTQSRVLAQRVQEYYWSLVAGSSDASNKPTKLPEDEEEVLADLDDEDVSAFGLPPKYSMLEDRHFPLFLTFDQLCSLLEADFGLKFKRLARTKADATSEKRFALSEIADVKIDLEQDDEVVQEDIEKPTSPMAETTERMLAAKQAAVTFEVFVAAYWPHFDYQLIKGLDPALVYSEFLGIIEGSEAALLSKSGALSRDEYTSLSHKKSSFASQRGRVYDLYEAYRKRKRQLGGYDAAERTHALVVETAKRVPGFKFDCLYIDEAQDNLLIDMKLLHNLSNNPHGIFVAGDTAQTISAGSSFRFEDLKAFLWRLEERDEAVQCGKRKSIHPTLFHLAVNYRSHGGIVDCASSITQLISELFPYSIDKLKKETGITDGPKPVFFSGWERGVVRFEQFLRGEAETKIDFGASQVILVRNEAARNDLRAQVGDIGLILTLYESKGLEFDDVLLYNFFEDSVPSESTWRVILQRLHATNIGPAPRFDEIRHAVICTELKNLYVGLTRARNHCWIWDVSEKAEPMKIFWRKQDLIKECGPNDPMPQLSVSSTEADWAKSGRLLFNKRLYPQAIFCFEKAGLLLERDIAAAYESRKQARLLQAAKSVDRATRRIAFTTAASQFIECAKSSKGKQQVSCYFRAAECH
ncbi:unnamed protein product, partial [Rhizoctonia solani]